MSYSLTAFELKHTIPVLAGACCTERPHFILFKENCMKDMENIQCLSVIAFWAAKYHNILPCTLLDRSYCTVFACHMETAREKYMMAILLSSFV